MLATEFTRLLQEHGWYAVHVRQNLQQPCTRCTGRETDRFCPRCLGTGHAVTLAPALVRSSGQFRPEFAGASQSPVGRVEVDRVSWYCLPSVRPQTGDLMLDVTWSVPTARVTREGQVLAVHRYFTLGRIEPYRGEGGQLFGYRLPAHDLDTDTQWLLPHVTHRPLGA